MLRNHNLIQKRKKKDQSKDKTEILKEKQFERWSTSKIYIMDSSKEIPLQNHHSDQNPDPYHVATTKKTQRLEETTTSGTLLCPSSIVKLVFC